MLPTRSSGRRFGRGKKWGGGNGSAMIETPVSLRPTLPREPDEMTEKIWFLKRCAIFQRLTTAERQRFESHAVMRTFRRGEMVYFPTEAGQSVLLLAEGRVKIKFLDTDGR